MKFIIVIDGLFGDEYIRLLGVAGWDGVFYYDEVGEQDAEINK